MGKFNELKRIPVFPRHAFPRLSKACGATQARGEDGETYTAAERPPNSSGILLANNRAIRLQPKWRP